MKQKTEEFLNFMLWNCARLLDPSFHNLTDSFQEWCRRTGANRRLIRLEQRHLIDSQTDPQTDPQADRLWRITDAGRSTIFGRRDPRTHWDRVWDGQWRMIMFDLRLDQNTERQRLRRYLHSRGFGCLQKSVWVTPHPLVDEATLLADTKVGARSMIFLNARPAAGESDEEIVAETWDFARINQQWRDYLAFLSTRPPASLASDSDALALFEWTNAERRQWLLAAAADPLLPKQLWPENYLGEQAWTERLKAMSSTSKQA